MLDGTGKSGREALAALQARLVRCRRCPRLVAHREAVAAAPPRRFRGEPYWARPVPSLGSVGARRWFEPIQPYLAVVSIVLLALALRARLRNALACPLPALPPGRTPPPQ